MSFQTLSGAPVEALYTQEDLPGDPAAAIGLPGEFPYTPACGRPPPARPT